MGGTDAGVRGRLNHGHFPIRPERVRQIFVPGGIGFSWVDRGLVRGGHLAGLSPEAGMLYLFLVTVADRFGVSYYGEEKVAGFTGLSRGILFDLVRELVRADLLAYRHPVYQVLSLPAGPGEGPSKSGAALPPRPPSCPAERTGRQEGAAGAIRSPVPWPAEPRAVVTAQATRAAWCRTGE